MIKFSKTGILLNRGNRIPVVLLILEGGRHSIRAARVAIEQNTPVIVIEGSGRAADLIVAASKLKASERSGDFNSQEHLNILWSSWKSLKASEAERGSLIKEVNEILAESRSHLLTIAKQSNDDSGQGLDKTIIIALIKAHNLDVTSQLNVALAWNRCDVAKQEIFSKRENWKDIDLNEAMLSALIQDRADFVNFYFECGVDLSTFLTVRRLHDLYKTVLMDLTPTPAVELLKSLLPPRTKMDSPHESRLLERIGSVISHLLEDHRENLYKDKKYIVNKDTTKDESDYLDSKTFDTLPDFQYPARDLLVWALLLNRIKLARILWKMGQDHISSALTCSMIMKALSAEATAKEQLDVAQQLSNTAQKFELMAVEVFDECYQKNEDTTGDLLIREIEQWGNKTLFVLANAAEQMDFMGHSCCQIKLNRVWRGKMVLATPMWKGEGDTSGGCRCGVDDKLCHPRCQNCH